MKMMMVFEYHVSCMRMIRFYVEISSRQSLLIPPRDCLLCSWL